MFQKARETAYLESTSILVLLIRWRKPLIIVTIVTALAAYLFSSPAFIQPKFKSSVVFFPSATNSVSKAIMEETNSEKQDTQKHLRWTLVKKNKLNKCYRS